MNPILLKITDSDLASRARAAAFRHQVLTIISNEGVVKMDLGSVESVSDSFADELFGVLAAALGLEQLTSKLKVTNASEAVYRVIALNIRNRLQQQAAA